MELRYHIKESEHIRFVHARRRADALSPFSVAVTLLLTVFPIALPLYAAYANIMSGASLLLCALLAVCLSCANFYFRTRNWRKQPPEKYAKGKELDPHLWSETHILTVSADGVKLRCGDQVREYPWQLFGGFEEAEGVLAPIFNAQFIDLIPLHELEQVGGSQAFQNIMTEAAKENLRKNVKQAADEAEKLVPVSTLTYRYSRENYLRDQRDSAHRRYLTRWIFNRNMVSKVSMALLMFYAMSTTSSILLKLVYLAIALILNAEHIAAFTSILDKQMTRLLQPILALHPDQEATFYLFTKSIRVVGELHFMEFPYSEITAVKMLPHGLAIYLKSQTTLTIPGSPENDDEELAKIYHFIRLAKGWER